MDQTKKKEIIFGMMREYCPHKIVFREKVDRITGGILLPNTMSNLDSRGIGLIKRRMIGRRVAYQIDDLIKWLVNNTELINFDE